MENERQRWEIVFNTYYGSVKCKARSFKRLVPDSPYSSHRPASAPLGFLTNFLLSPSLSLIPYFRRMRGLVLRSTGAWYEVKAEDGTIWQCRIRGKFRTKGLRTTNPIAVGDQVQIEPEEVEGQAVIKEIEPRKNYIIRKSVNLSKEAHIVASNVDQAFLFATLKLPRTSAGFIDRFLVTAEAYTIEAIVVFNKIDLLDEAEKEELANFVNTYESIGYKVRQISAETGEGTLELYAEMAGKTNMLTGHSGVGKSTFINKVDPDLDIKTAEISELYKKGKHTTTYAEMHLLKNGGYIIDTPGIKGFGIVDIPKEEIHHHFPEMFALLPDCKFHNCLHIDEPKCAVKAAVERGEIPASRYKSYATMYSDDEDETYRAPF